ncbi:MAG: hypothetical protein R3F42_00480 [Pseudomonadota bacterium]
MKIRAFVSSTLLAAALGLGSSTPAQAHDSFVSLWWLDHDHHLPRAHHSGYYDDHGHGRYYRRFWDHHNVDRHDGRRERERRHDRERDYDRHDGHDRDRHH